MDKEAGNVKQALFNDCGHPEWSFKKVRQHLNQRAAESKKKMKDTNKETRTTTLVTIPYVQGLCGPFSKGFLCHWVATTMRPHQTPKEHAGTHKGHMDTLQEQRCIVLRLVNTVSNSTEVSLGKGLVTGINNTGRMWPQSGTRNTPNPERKTQCQRCILQHSPLITSAEQSHNKLAKSATLNGGDHLGYTRASKRQL